MSATSNPRDAPPIQKSALHQLALNKPVDSLKALLTRHEHFTKLAALLLLGETVLCCLIIQFVPCECFRELQRYGRSEERRCRGLLGCRKVQWFAAEG